ncbi:MAG TPA: hypothetical protein VFZ48_03815 [Candidatus Saccharimonadales bacterium]
MSLPYNTPTTYSDPELWLKASCDGDAELKLLLAQSQAVLMQTGPATDRAAHYLVPLIEALWQAREAGRWLNLTTFRINLKEEHIGKGYAQACLQLIEGGFVDYQPPRSITFKPPNGLTAVA